VSAEATELVFLVDPLSPLALVAAGAVCALVIYYGVATFRAAGRLRGLVLFVLRALAVLTLSLLLLQPSLLSTVPVKSSLPDDFTHKEVRVLDASEMRGLLPPVTSLPLPELAPGMDVAVEGVVAPPVAFLKSQCTVRATLVNDGPPQRGDVVLTRLERTGSMELSRTRVELKSGRQDVGISVVPETIGESAYGVILEGFVRDGKSDNNSAPFSLTVARDTMRVLHIAGHPSWDVRFLRQFLSSHPGVELISFYLLVEAEDFAPHSREELALIPFPTDELFLRELGNFDLLIIHNFPLGTYFLLTEKHLDRLRLFVEQGGALMFLGGDKAFSLGGVEKTPLADILPVALPAADEKPGYVEGPLKAHLAPGGLSHPVTTALVRGEEVPFSFSGLPPLAGANALGVPRPGSGVLAAVSSPSGTLPLIVTGKAQKGRILLVATDSLWKWAFPASLSHDSSSFYRRFFMNALAWLTRDPRMDELEIMALEGATLEGRETGATVCIKGAAEPGAVAEVRAEWRDVGGKQPAFRLELQAPLENSRCATVVLPPARAGAWMVSGVVETDSREFRGSSVVVLQRERETYVDQLTRRIRPMLATSFHPFMVDRPFSISLGTRELTLARPVITPVWSSPYLFAFLLLLLVTEWYLRKRWGYL
jgi:uncharacterized membrane protein